MPSLADGFHTTLSLVTSHHPPLPLNNHSLPDSLDRTLDKPRSDQCKRLAHLPLSCHRRALPYYSHSTIRCC